METIRINISDMESEKFAVISFYKKQVEAFRHIKKEIEKARWADAKYDELVESLNVIGKTLADVFQTVTNGDDVYIISELAFLADDYLENERYFPKI